MLQEAKKESLENPKDNVFAKKLKNLYDYEEIEYISCEEQRYYFYLDSIVKMFHGKDVLIPIDFEDAFKPGNKLNLARTRGDYLCPCFWWPIKDNPMRGKYSFTPRRVLYSDPGISWKISETEAWYLRFKYGTTPIVPVPTISSKDICEPIFITARPEIGHLEKREIQSKRYDWALESMVVSRSFRNFVRNKDGEVISNFCYDFDYDNYFRYSCMFSIYDFKSDKFREILNKAHEYPEKMEFTWHSDLDKKFFWSDVKTSGYEKHFSGSFAC